ncbi:MAG: Gfo/Idh/MocA family oxidoreductase [Planctomycetota bacterium]|nr:Gfo/Idh/MocA family oxidoreductase [Planctomycetota bacterium]
MPKRLKLALVGAGHMGKLHAQAISERPDAQLVAVCDIDAARAAAVAGPAGAQVETDPSRLAGRVDAAVIAAATSVHGDVAVPLMKAGIAVLLEKPVAGTAAEARAIADAARRAGVVAQAGHILRFDPVTRAFACLGLRPRYIEVSWVAPFSFRSLDVGVVMDLMIHGLDVVLHLAGGMPERIDAVGGVVVGPHEDFASARLAFPGPVRPPVLGGGLVATFAASRMSRTRQRTIRLFCEGTYLKLDYGARTVERVTARPGLAEAVRSGQPPAGGMQDLVAVEKLPVEDRPDALRAQLASFIEAVRGEHPPAVTLEDGARAVEVAERIIQAVENPK